MRKTVPCLVLLFVVAVPAVHAGTFFIGASAGQANVRNVLQGFTVDGDDVGFKAYAGYRFVPAFFIEGSYADLGSFKDTFPSSSIESDARAYGLWAAGNVPLGRMFAFFIRLGVAQTESDFKVDRVAGPSTSGSSSDTNLAWGFGFGVNLGKRVTLRAEYEGYESDVVDKLEFLSVGVQINF